MWEGNLEAKGFHLVKWYNVRSFKQEGALGIKI